MYTKVLNEAIVPESGVDEDLLQLLVGKVDNKLLKAVLLYISTIVGKIFEQNLREK